MSLEPTPTPTLIPTRIVVARAKRRPIGVWIAVGATMVLVATVGARAWEAGFKIQDLWRERPIPLALLDVDEGPIEVSVTETGTLESAVNSKVKCQVESLLGNVTSSTTGGRTGTTGSASSAGRGGAGGASGQGGAQGANAGGATSAKPSARSKAKEKSGAAAKSGSSSGGSSSKTAATSGSSSGGSSIAGTSSDLSGSTSTTGKKPTIRSFTYQVAKYVPLRGTATKAAQTTAKSASSTAGGGRGGSGGSAETAGSTRIIEILPEGTHA